MDWNQSVRSGRRASRLPAVWAALLVALVVSFSACSRSENPAVVTHRADVEGQSKKPLARYAVRSGSGAGDQAKRDREDDSLRDPDVVYVPTPQPVVDRMLELADVSKDDLVYDLGCGDGRIVVTAAKKYGARGYGVDIDPQRVSEARSNVEDQGVEELVTIEHGDAFEVDLENATVVTLYLLPSLNVKLLPQLRALEPGVPVVSHDFAIEGVRPDEVETLEVNGKEHRIYLFTTPLEG